MENNEVIEVYHFDMNAAMHSGKSLYFMRPEAKDVAQLAEKGIYHKVAEVKTDDLEVAFEKTNHIDKAWQENTEVTSFTEKARSTSVGDVCIKGEEVFVVSSIGFEKIPSEIKNLLQNEVKKNKRYNI